jgi:hypothetical protein
MSMDELFDLVLGLPDEARVLLVHRLLLSLVPPGEEVIQEQAWERAWLEELQNHLSRFDRGETTAGDARESLADIQARFARAQRVGE